MIYYANNIIIRKLILRPYGTWVLHGWFFATDISSLRDLPIFRSYGTSAVIWIPAYPFAGFRYLCSLICKCTFPPGNYEDWCCPKSWWGSLLPVVPAMCISEDKDQTEHTLHCNIINRLMKLDLDIKSARDFRDR